MKPWSAKKSRIQIYPFSPSEPRCLLLCDRARTRRRPATRRPRHRRPKSDEDLTEILVYRHLGRSRLAQEIKRSDAVVDLDHRIRHRRLPRQVRRRSAAARDRRHRDAFRCASGDTTHFSAEPSGVVIRGLPQVRSEFNGRDSFNANSSRGLSFGDVSPELDGGRRHLQERHRGHDRRRYRRHGQPADATCPSTPKASWLRSRANSGYGNLAAKPKPSGSAASQQSLGNRHRRFRHHGQRRAISASRHRVAGRADSLRFYPRRQRRRLRRRHRSGSRAASTSARTPTTAPRKGGVGRRRSGRSPEDTAPPAAIQPLRVREQLGRVFPRARASGDAQTPQSALIITNEFSAPAANDAPAYEFDSRGVFTRGIISEALANNGWYGRSGRRSDPRPPERLWPERSACYAVVRGRYARRSRRGSRRRYRSLPRADERRRRSLLNLGVGGDWDLQPNRGDRRRS